MRNDRPDVGKTVCGWKNLPRCCRPYRSLLIPAALAAALSAVLTLQGPGKLAALAKVIADGMSGGTDMARVSTLGLTLAACYGGGWALSLLHRLIMNDAARRLSRQLRRDISRKIDRLSMSYYSAASTGDVLSRMTNDADTVSQSLMRNAANLVSAVTLLLGALALMLRTNVMLALTAAGAALAGCGLTAAIMGGGRKCFARRREAMDAVNSHIEEIYSGHQVVIACNAAGETRSQFHALNAPLEGHGFKAMCLSGLVQPLMGFTGNLGYAAVCTAGAAMTMGGSIGFEAVVAFLLYVRYFTQPLSQIAQGLRSMRQTAAAVGRVFSFLDAAEMEGEDGKAEAPGDAVGHKESLP